MSQEPNKVGAEEILKVLREFDQRLKALEAGTNVIYEAPFKKSIRIQENHQDKSIYIEGAGVVREFKDSDSFVISWKNSEAVSIISKYDIQGIELDANLKENKDA